MARINRLSNDVDIDEIHRVLAELLRDFYILQSTGGGTYTDPNYPTRSFSLAIDIVNEGTAEEYIQHKWVEL